jgi:hypothetical protein
MVGPRVTLFLACSLAKSDAINHGNQRQLLENGMEVKETTFKDHRKMWKAVRAHLEVITQTEMFTGTDYSKAVI